MIEEDLVSLLKCPRCSFTVSPEEMESNDLVCPRCALKANRAIPLSYHRQPVGENPYLLTVRTTEDGGAVSIDAEGEVDLNTADELERPLAEGLGRGERVLLDLTEVSFIDSSGIAALLRAAKAVDGAGALRVVVDPDSQVARVFGVARLELLLQIFTTRGEALHGLGAPGAVR
jgi:anti-sigma B factor antagonist